ncbi:MAG: hypothetical protein AB2693_33995 [Candidatus Thiodiazotropha sp.]
MSKDDKTKEIFENEITAKLANTTANYTLNETDSTDPGKTVITNTAHKKKTKMKKRKQKNDEVRPKKEQSFYTKEKSPSNIEEKEIYQTKSTAEMDSILVGKTLQGVNDTVTGVKEEETSQENMTHKVSKKKKKKKKIHQTDRLNTERGSTDYKNNISSSLLDFAGSSKSHEQVQSREAESIFRKGLLEDQEYKDNEVQREKFEYILEDKVNLHTEMNASHATNFTSKSFHISLSSAQWENIKPLNVSGTRYKLEGDWTDQLSKKVWEKYPGCVLSFKMNRVKSLSSRKINAPFFHGKAECKGEFCTAKFAFKLDHEPVPGNEAEIFCTVEGPVIHFPDEGNKRQIKGTARKNVAAAASQIGAVNYYYDALSETPVKELELGNVSRCQTPSVIRKIVSEVVTKQHLHTDIVEELKLLKEVFEDEEEEVLKTDINGYIQEIGTDPFTVVLVSKDQIQLIRKLSCLKKLDIYIDATGSVIGNIPNQSKPYLYSLVVRPDPEVPPISVADMLTTQHSQLRVFHGFS